MYGVKGGERQALGAGPDEKSLFLTIGASFKS